MKKTLQIAGACAVMTCATTAFAEQPYIGIDYQLSQVKSSEAKVNLASILLRAGTRVDTYWGFEVQYAKGIQDDSFTGTDGTIYNVKSKGQYAAFFKPQLDLNSDISIYGLLGANYSDISRDGITVQDSNYGTSFAAGVGANLFFDKNWGVGIEYAMYDKDINALNVGLRYKF